jgi:hypothetical protein
MTVHADRHQDQHRAIILDPLDAAQNTLRDDDSRDMAELSPVFRHEFERLQYNFRELASTPLDESQALVLRLTRAPRPSVRSRRRSIRQCLPPRG